jgi:cold shock protein
MRGTIRKLNMEKGFGFIRTKDATDYFFHRSGCSDSTRFESLQEGQTVEFTPGDSPKGLRATDVKG